MNLADLSRLVIDRTSVTASRPWRSRALLGVIAIAIVVLGGTVAMRWAYAPARVETAMVILAHPSSALTVLNATGRVTASRKASVSTKATGRLEWLGVEEGSRVRARQVIARLENLDVAAGRDSAAASTHAARANLEQGMAELRDAESNLRRSTDLFARKFITEATLDSARARHDKALAAIASLEAAIAVAQANTRQAEVMLEQTLIRAPFDGIVLTKNANVGDIITPFSSATDSKGAVVNMADMETLEVEADVSESAIAKIDVGMPAEIQLDAYPELRMSGHVARIVPTVDRSKATLLAKVTFDEKDRRILPDMSAKVAFLSRAPGDGERKPVAAVRAEALASRGTSHVVYVVTPEGRAREMRLSEVNRLGDLVAVPGIDPGTKVVVNAPGGLRDGDAIAVARK